jgi:hypothetical protein
MVRGRDKDQLIDRSRRRGGRPGHGVDTVGNNPSTSGAFESYHTVGVRAGYYGHRFQLTDSRPIGPGILGRFSVVVSTTLVLVSDATAPALLMSVTVKPVVTDCPVGPPD